MSDLTKTILILAGSLVITCAIIALYFGISNNLNSQVEAQKTRQEQTLEYLENYDITKYDGMTIYGSDAISYVKQIASKINLVVTDNGGVLEAYTHIDETTYRGKYLSQYETLMQNNHLGSNPHYSYTGISDVVSSILPTSQNAVIVIYNDDNVPIIAYIQRK